MKKHLEERSQQPCGSRRKTETPNRSTTHSRATSIYKYLVNTSSVYCIEEVYIITTIGIDIQHEQSAGMEDHRRGSVNHGS